MRIIRKRLLPVIFTLITLLSIFFATAVFASASADEVKSALAAELDRFESADSSLYTQESFAAWQSAYNDGRIINNTPGASEDELRSALNALKEAYDALDKKGDVAPLVAKLSEIAEIELAPYTPESVDALMAACEKAEAILTKFDVSEREINGAIEELELRRAMLKEIADFGALISSVTDAKRIDLSKYSDDSATAVKAAIALAEAIISDKNSPKSLIDSAIATLIEKVAALTYDTKSERLILLEMIDEINAMDLSPYTPQTADELRRAKSSAESVLNATDATDEDLHEAIVDLSEKLGALWEIADFSALTDALTKAKSIDTSIYTGKTVSALLEAIAVAETVSSDKNSSQSLVNSAKAKLSSAVDGLKLWSAATGQIDKLIAEIQLLPMIYTVNSISPLLSKCEEAIRLLEEKPTQSEIDAMAKKLSNLKAYLIIDSERSTLYDRISAAEAKDLQNYTPKRRNEYTAACEEAKLILNNLDSTDEDISTAISVIEDAGVELVRGDKTKSRPFWLWLIFIVVAFFAFCLFCVGCDEYGAAKYAEIIIGLAVLALCALWMFWPSTFWWITWWYY